MHCNLCKTKQVTPGDLNKLKIDHKYIKLQRNKLIHVAHINNKQENQISTEQPKRLLPHDIEKSTSESISIENKTIETHVNLAYSQITNESGESKQPSADSTETFTSFINNTFKFKKKIANGLVLNDATDTLGFKVIYKNKIRLGNINNNKSLMNESQPAQPQITSNKLPLLFYIHGVGGNYKIWENQFEFFSNKNYEIVAIDLIGHGSSNTPSEVYNYQFLEMALDVLLIFDMFAFGNGENVIIGHSYGCSFATYLAQSRSSIVNKLILISGGSPHPLDYKSPLLSAPLCFIKLIKPLIDCHFNCSAFSSYLNRPKNSEDAFNVSAKVLFYVMKGQIWRTANEEYHKTIKQKVLLIEGEDDNFVPIEDAYDMIKILNHAYLAILSKGSHMIIMEKYDIINNLINLFLNDTFN